ncbi:AI-2E family transporter [Alloacidobacterium dinghuense]|uniref:AI-2E family transporter n=1 Tax=Alloacidobacterium dinghuense TaxID=2763107 RepID=A0A7G8BHX8_9BACT|nr:AI-2E family transporter [Alloacidobacterium dinghuense]QNI32148.1 AI-2E family transporter [Alloacidobacterium dinghuense]
MATEPPLSDNRYYIRRALEVAIHVGLLVLLTTACLLILRPFLPLVAWGIIIAIATFPAYKKLRSLLGGRGTLAAVLCTLAFLAVLIVPVALLTDTLISGIRGLTAQVRAGNISIPPPPESVKGWPLVGAPLSRVWDMAYTNLSGLLKSLTPQIREFLPRLLHTSAGIGLTVVQFILSIVVAGVLLANASGGVSVTHLLAARLFGDRGPEFEELAGSTVRSVTNGIIGVAVIQAVLAGIGFLVAGLPGAGLWCLVFLFGCVLQIGGIVLIPAIIYVFAIASTTKAVVFLVWCVIVVLSEHVLKPLLLGRGVAVPIVVVFLGAIGGFLAIGIIGLFVGAIVLSVGYKLLLAWLEGPTEAKQGT